MSFKKVLILFALLNVLLGFDNIGRVPNTNLTLHWKFLPDSYLELRLEWRQPTFLVLLLGADMFNKDLWLCSKEAGMTDWTVMDRWYLLFRCRAFAHRPPINDTSSTLNGTDDFSDKSVTANDSTVVCEFRRKLVTEDKYDLPLVKGNTIHVCSIFSTTPDLKMHATPSSRFCFYWPLLDGFNGDLSSEPIVEDNTWELVHGIVMSIGWGVLVDFALAAVRYFRVRKHYTTSHAIFFFVINLTTIPMAVLMVVRNNRSILYNFDILEWQVKTHFLLGSSLVLLIIAQHVLGIFTKLAQEDTFEESIAQYRKRRLAHRILGGCVYLLTKLQLVLGWWIYGDGSFTLLMGLLLGWYVILVFLHFLLNCLYNRSKLNGAHSGPVDPASGTMKSLIEESENGEADSDLMTMVNRNRTQVQIEAAFPMVTYFHFKDKIINLTEFTHPGGQAIFRFLNGKDITKYVYGSAALDYDLKVRHQHSKSAFQLLEGKSIGVKSNIAQITSHALWEQSTVQELSRDMFRFCFRNRTLTLPTNPKDPHSYLGKFWLVTSKGVIRPYTLMLSQLQCNVQYRSALLQAYRDNFQARIKIVKQDTTDQIILMVKKYATGNVSKSIHEQVDSIEGIFGTGLDLQKGTNVIITGGTGILPFLDLFDLLLKKAICLAAGNINTDIDLDVYGIGYATILPSVKVKLFASFTSFEELNNYQWLVDLHIISKNHKLGLFEMHVRLPEGQTAVSEIAQFQERIGQQFLIIHANPNEVERLLICGPPAMNNELLVLASSMAYASFMVL